MKEQKPIIKKVKKVEGGGHHGGSWKVAYADFVTAMMAFFLLMWLITMTSPEKRARVAHYFKHFSIFEKSGSSMMEGSQGMIEGHGSTSSVESPREEDPTTGEAVPQEEVRGGSPGLKKTDLAEKLEFLVQYSLVEVRDQVIVEVVPEGVRIQVVDQERRSFFAAGSAQLTDRARQVLRVLANALGTLENRITIEGHTDASSYASDKYTNWELSTDRASSARREMEKAGFNPDKIARVAGYAATQPLFPQNPYDPRNRRISITVLFPREDTGGPSGPRR